MNAIGMGAILSGFYDGLDKQNEINYRAGERKHLAERRTVEEGRQDTAYSQSQDDRTHDIARRGITEGRQDTAYGQQQESYQHGMERRPVEELQKDTAFNTGQEAAHLNMDLAKKQDSRADKQLALSQAEFGSRQRVEKIRAEMAQLGLDDARVAAGYRKSEQQLMPLFQQYQVDKDPTVFQDWYNNHVGDGNQVKIVKNDKGTFDIQSNRGTSQQGVSGDEIARMARTLVRPDVYMESLYAGVKAHQEQEAARAKNPKNFGEPVQAADGTTGMLDYNTGTVRQIKGEDGKPFTGIVHGSGAGTKPAMLQEVDALNQNMPQIEGETPTARWMRAYSSANKRLTADPAQAKADFYSKTLQKLLPDPQFGAPTPDKLKKAQDTAQGLADQFASTYLTSGHTPQGPVSTMAGKSTTVAPSAPTQPATAPATAPKFIEGKTYKDGSGTVARYVNGQFVPVQ